MSNATNTPPATERWWEDMEGLREAVKELARKHPGLLNRYSGTLLAIYLGCIFWGLIIFSHKNHLGWIPFSIGLILLATGIDWPKEGTPSKVWVLILFGNPTGVRVTGLTLLMKAGVLTYKEISLIQVPMSLKLTKPVQCMGGGYIEGTVSITVVADDEDDPVGIHDPMPAGVKLVQFVNATGSGDKKKMEEQSDDLLTDWTEFLGKSRTAEDMERGGMALNSELAGYASGRKQPSMGSNDEELNTFRGMGLKVVKLQCIFVATKPVIDERVGVKVQEARAKALAADVNMMEQLIASRIEFLSRDLVDASGKLIRKGLTSEQMPLYEVLRKQIMDEALLHDQRIQKIEGRTGIIVDDDKKGGKKV